MTATTEPVHVIVVSHGFQSHYELGFSNGLAKNGIQVTLLGSDTTLAGQLHPRVDFRNIRGSHDPCRSAWAKASNMIRYHARLLWFVATHRHAAVMIIGLLKPEWLVGVAEGIVLRLLARKVTLTVHNILPHDRHTDGMRKVFALIYRLPQFLLVHTPDTRDALMREFGVPARKILTVEHGVNDAIEICSLPQAGLRAELGLGTDDTVVLFFGAVLPYKGLDLLAEALEEHPSVKLLVAGRCAGDEYGQRMRAKLRELQSAGRAVWLDRYVEDAEVGRIFASADAIALPYRHIDQSGVLLLALTLGLPVIATPVGALPRFVDEETGVLARETSASALAEAIATFLPRPRKFHSERIREVAGRYSWENTCKPLMACLLDRQESLVNG